MRRDIFDLRRENLKLVKIFFGDFSEDSFDYFFIICMDCLISRAEHIEPEFPIVYDTISESLLDDGSWTSNTLISSIEKKILKDFPGKLESILESLDDTIFF